VELSTDNEDKLFASRISSLHVPTGQHTVLVRCTITAWGFTRTRYACSFEQRRAAAMYRTPRFAKMVVHVRVVFVSDMESREQGIRFGSNDSVEKYNWVVKRECVKGGGGVVIVCFLFES
jgi:hypothetical protein